MKPEYFSDPIFAALWDELCARTPASNEAWSWPNKALETIPLLTKYSPWTRRDKVIEFRRLILVQDVSCENCPEGDHIHQIPRTRLYHWHFSEEGNAPCTTSTWKP